MKLTIHPSESRGHANYGWLDTHYSYSFANYYNPERMGFGPLRVLNDDTIAPNNGFQRHGHKDMEIVTIMLSGEIEHTDSMGNQSTLQAGQIQVMSAGTGVMHSEMNPSTTEPTKLIQLWIEPETLGITPRYAETDFKAIPNTLHTLISPLSTTNGDIQINQQAYILLGDFSTATTLTYTTKLLTNHFGFAMFVLEGEVMIEGKTLVTRDMIEVTEATILEMTITKNTKFLLFDL